MDGRFVELGGDMGDWGLYGKGELDGCGEGLLKLRSLKKMSEIGMGF